MIEINRMELEDVGGNPIKLAQAVLSQLPNVSLPIPIRDIAYALNIYEIKEENGVSFEGALIAPDDKSEGAIAIRADRSEERKRFTIGHELCHYLSPWHTSDNPAGFQCSTAFMAAERSDKNNRLMKMEAEANEFAAEILIPLQEIKKYLHTKTNSDLNHIMRMAFLFEVSKEAMARRYVMCNSKDPSAIIFSKNNVIRYIKKHPDFPWLNVKYNDILPLDSISATNNSRIGEITNWTEVGAGIWLDASQNMTVYEQTAVQNNGFRLTLLTYEVTTEYDLDDDDEINIEDSWTPRFAYGR